jgi:hypothetical protein
MKKGEGGSQAMGVLYSQHRMVLAPWKRHSRAGRAWQANKQTFALSLCSVSASVHGTAPLHFFDVTGTPTTRQRRHTWMLPAACSSTKPCIPSDWRVPVFCGELEHKPAIVWGGAH